MLLCGGAKRERQRLQLDLIGSILSCPFFRCLAIDHGMRSWLDWGTVATIARRPRARRRRQPVAQPHGPRVQGG